MVLVMAKTSMGSFCASVAPKAVRESTPVTPDASGFPTVDTTACAERAVTFEAVTETP